MLIGSDIQLQQDVLDELDADPEVLVSDIGVRSADGVVTLTGTVRSLQEKWAAEQAASRVAGVRAVANEIEVQPPGMPAISDGDIAGAVATALEWHPSVPFDAIDIAVDHGQVRLRGEVDWHYQREAAEAAARQVAGVRAITNEIVVEQPLVPPDSIQRAIEQALARNAVLDARKIHVAVHDGHVTLSGTVQSFSERHVAESAAWPAAGVTEVSNQIRVSPM